MIKQISTVKYIVLAILLFLALPVSAASVPGPGPELDVNFLPNPLFGEVNLSPGKTVAASIMVGNNSDQAKPIAIEAINIADPDNFASVLDFEIKKESNVLFSNTLENFFDQGEMYLSDVGSGQEVVYDLYLTFNKEAGNDWQAKTLNNFDILIGFQGEEVVVSSAGSSGGGGLPPGLSIYNETEVKVTQTEAEISWQTNYNSTTRVVYSSENDPHTFSILDYPKYGYTKSTLEIDSPAGSSGVTYHTITITGLTPNTTYYYRAVSHASPDTVGAQQSFKTTTNKEVVLGDQTEQQPQDKIVVTTEKNKRQNSQAQEDMHPGDPVLVNNVDGEGKYEIILEDDTLPEPIVKGESTEQQSCSCFICPTWLCWLIVLLLVLIFIRISRAIFKKTKEKDSNFVGKK